MWARWLNLFLGVWLVTAPTVFDYPEPLPRINDAAVGFLIASFALASSLVPSLRFVTTVLGAWLVAAPMLLGYHDAPAATVNDIAVGALVLCFSLMPERREDWRGVRRTTPV